MYLSTTITASPSVISERMQTFLEVLITPSTIPRQYPASKPCVDFLQYPASSFPSNLSGVSSFTTPKAANENNITKAIKDMFFIVVSFVDFHCVCCHATGRKCRTARGCSLLTVDLESDLPFPIYPRENDDGAVARSSAVHSDQGSLLRHRCRQPSASAASLRRE